MKEIKHGTITTPLGFRANALCCGIKKKKDLALIYSVICANAAGVFTTNRMRAACVDIDLLNLRRGRAQAIIVNSGNANCCTGQKGKKDAWRVVSALAKQLELEKEEILVASTGVIGKFLPADKIVRSIPDLVDGLDFNKGKEAATAIMTTDTFSKQAAMEINIAGKKVRIGAVAKGAGMIRPDMATMLCFITTDANITSAALKLALKEAVDGSFNRISVDAQMSTNDSVIILANALARNPLICKQGRNLRLFTCALTFVCQKLARMIVEDAEGATKVIRILVAGARSNKEAKQAAYAVADSLLVKTMIAGANPNWGRIPAALGAAKVDFAAEKLKIALQKQVVYRNSAPGGIKREKLIKLLKKKEVEIDINLASGKHEYSLLSCDLTCEYVRINTAYN